MPLCLGNITLVDFEIPSVVAFGGGQALAVHKLPGGVRIVDALGPDDSDIAWRGVISGADATNRSRSLDSLRVSGQPIVLSWDEFSYSVIIRSLRFRFCNSWWIPYRIECLVLNDQNIDSPSEIASIIGSVSADLLLAASLTDVSQATSAIATAAQSGAGTALYASAYMALSGAAGRINDSIIDSEKALKSNDISTIVSAAGSLAVATAARGYVGRAIVNYSQVAF